MQVPTLPPVVTVAALPQEVGAKAVPHAQAAAPLIQHAVDPTPKSQKFNEVKTNKDRSNRNRNQRERPDEDDKKSDHSVNIRV